MAKPRNPYGNRKSAVRAKHHVKLSRVSGVYGSYRSRRCSCGGNGRDRLDQNKPHRACDGQGSLSA